MNKYLVEWTCSHIVKPALTAEVGGPHKINNEPALTNTGGWLYISAKSEGAAINMFKRDWRNRKARCKATLV